MSGITGDQGPACRRCRATEARCAWAHGSCCGSCTHWLHYDGNGDDVKSAEGGRRRLPVEHGSERGYQQHRVRHELPCQACSAAHSVHVIARRAS